MDGVIQTLGDLDGISKGDISFTPLDKADEIRGKAGVLGQLFLGPTPFEPQLPDVDAELLDDGFFVHVFNLWLIPRFYHSLLVVFGMKSRSLFPFGRIFKFCFEKGRAYSVDVFKVGGLI